MQSNQNKKTHYVGLNKHSFLGNWPGFLARRARSEVRELYVNSAILDLAVAMVLFFEPIYLYQQGISLTGIMLFYLGVYGTYFIILPLGGKFAKKRGFEHSIFLGTPFLILYYLCFVLVAKSWIFLAPAAIFLALQKTFYWPGYHADFAYFGQEAEQGRELSNLTVILSAVFILGPLIGGAILYFFGFTVLFIVVAFLIVLSNFPLVLTPERFVPSEFSYRDTYRRLFKPENKRALLAYLGFGEEIIAMALWPIFLFIVFKTTLATGGIIAVSTFITSMVVLYVGKITDQRSHQSVLKLTTVIYAFSWLIRTAVRLPLGVFLADTYSNIGKTSLSVPLYAMTYHRARERGVVKNVIFFEMALVLGKILAILLVLLILILAPEAQSWTLIFLLAAFFTLFYSLLDERRP